MRVDIVKTSETGKTNNIDRDAAGDVMGLLAMLSLCNRDDPSKPYPDDVISALACCVRRGALGRRYKAEIGWRIRMRGSRDGQPAGKHINQKLFVAIIWTVDENTVLVRAWAKACHESRLADWYLHSDLSAAGFRAT